MTNESNHQFHTVIDELKLLRKRNLPVDLEFIGTIEQVLKFEHLIFAISSKFTSIDVSQVNKEIENGLQQIVEFLQLDRSSFFQISPDKKHFISKYSYACNELKPLRTKIGAKLFPWAFRNTKAGNILWFESHEDLPEEAENDAKYFKKLDIQAGCLVPIFINNENKYALTLDLKNKRSEKWPESLFPRIQVLGEIFANAVERNRYEIQLKELLKLSNKYKKELEFENFYLRKKQNPDDDLKLISNDLKYDKSVLWVSKGIEHYAENRNLKLNNICKTIGLSKTSFYNIYPNYETSNGFDRYKRDFIGFIDYKLATIFNQINELIKGYSGDDMLKMFSEACFQNYTYFKCLALMIIEKEDAELILAGQKIHKGLQKVIVNYVKKVTDSNKKPGKKLTGMKNSLINTIYHQSLVAEPKEWRKSIIEISEGF